MKTKVIINVEGIKIGTIFIESLDCGSGTHTYTFKPSVIFSIIPDVDQVKKRALNELSFVIKEILEDMNGNKVG